MTIRTYGNAEDCLPRIVDRLVREFRPIRIILFGSQVRGQARWDSDIDLLVVLPHVENKGEVMVQMLDAVGDISVATDIIPTDPDEIARRGHLAGTVLRSALREGKVLYERTR